MHHVFSVCAWLMPLMSLLECLCERLGVVFTVGMFIMGYRYSVCSGEVGYLASKEEQGQRWVDNRSFNII